MTQSRFRLLYTIIWIVAIPWMLWPTWAPLLAALSLLSLLVPVLARRWSFRRTILDSFILFYLAAATLAYLLSPAPALSLPKLTTLALGAIGYYLLQEWLTTPGRIWQLTLLLALAAAAIAVLAPFVIIWPERQILDLRFFTRHIPHLTGDFGVHSNEIGGALAFLFPFAVAIAGQATPWPGRRWLRLLPVALAGGGLFLSQSRGALLALLLAALVWVTWSRLRLQSVVRAILLVTLLAMVAFAAGVDGDDVSTWAARLDAQSKSGEEATSSWPMRLEIWRAAGQMLCDYPVFGAGLYAFVPVSRANYVYEIVQPETDITHAHNLFLQAGASLGWPGLLALLALWATLLLGLWRAGREVDRPLRRLAAIYGTGAIAYLAFNLFDLISLGQRPGVLVWLILGGGAALLRLEGRPATPSLWWRLGPLLLLCGLSLTPLLPRNLANWRLDQMRVAGRPAGLLSPEAFSHDVRRRGLVYWLQGNRARALADWRGDAGATAFLQNQGVQASAAGDAAGALAWYDLALALDDTLPTVYFWRGVAYQRESAHSLAKIEFERALHYARLGQLDARWQAQVLFHSARSDVERKNWRAAEATLRRAIGLYEADVYYQLLGDVLAMQGDERGARDAYRRAGLGLHQ